MKQIQKQIPKTKQSGFSELEQSVEEQIEQGKKFVELDSNLVEPPEGFSVVTKRYTNAKGEKEVTTHLVPQKLLFYAANPGEGNNDEAIDDLAEFYTEVKAHETQMMKQGKFSTNETNWALIGRNAYRTYLIDKIIKGSYNIRTQELVPELNYSELENLGLLFKKENDILELKNKIDKNLRLIAAKNLGIDEEILEEYGLSDIIKHVTVTKTEKLTLKELKEVTCYAGSHFDLKDKYKNSSEVKYSVNTKWINDDLSKASGTKTMSVDLKETSPVVEIENKKLIDQIMEESQTGNKNFAVDYNPHKRNILRILANMKYIAGNDPTKQLDIEPPALTSQKIQYKKLDLKSKNLE